MIAPRDIDNDIDTQSPVFCPFDQETPTGHFIDPIQGVQEQGGGSILTVNAKCEGRKRFNRLRLKAEHADLSGVSKDRRRSKAEYIDLSDDCEDSHGVKTEIIELRDDAQDRLRLRPEIINLCDDLDVVNNLAQEGHSDKAVVQVVVPPPPDLPPDEIRNTLDTNLNSCIPNETSNHGGLSPAQDVRGDSVAQENTESTLGLEPRDMSYTPQVVETPNTLGNASGEAAPEKQILKENCREGPQQPLKTVSFATSSEHKQKDLSEETRHAHHETTPGGKTVNRRDSDHTLDGSVAGSLDGSVADSLSSSVAASLSGPMPGSLSGSVAGSLGGSVNATVTASSVRVTPTRNVQSGSCGKMANASKTSPSACSRIPSPTDSQPNHVKCDASKTIPDSIVSSSILNPPGLTVLALINKDSRVAACEWRTLSVDARPEEDLEDFADVYSSDSDEDVTQNKDVEAAVDVTEHEDIGMQGRYSWVFAVFINQFSQAVSLKPL